MKRICFIVLTILVSCVAVSAQETRTEKRMESYISLGGGLFMETGNRADEPGIALRISYGLDIPFNEEWSIMPGAGLRTLYGDIRHFMWIGGDPHIMELADVFLVARYHSTNEGYPIVWGLGPAFSYAVMPDTYYVDANPNDPLDGKETFLPYDIGLLSSISCPVGKHFHWGLEASIGLLNAMKQYPEYNRTGSIHLHYMAITCGWHF